MLDFVTQTGHMWLPTVFMILLGVALTLYTILDGFDLGIGILSRRADNEEQRDQMISTIAPYWDANETWLVLCIGIVFIAFPHAYAALMKTFYIPIFLMLFAIILRGISFDFRTKAHTNKKILWNTLFYLGSLLMALTQGYMVGLYVMGLDTSFKDQIFAIITALSLVSAYALAGSTWLLIKSSGQLQTNAKKWTKTSLLLTTLGIIVMAIAMPLDNPIVRESWSHMPVVITLAVLAVVGIVLILTICRKTSQISQDNEKATWLPFVATALLFILCLIGLDVTFYPYIIPGGLTLAETTAAPFSLFTVLVGATFVVPVIIGYTIYIHFIFRGKIHEVDYY